MAVKSFPLIVSAAVLCAIAAVPATASGVRGQVLDPARAPIAKARITVTGAENGVIQAVSSDAGGEFSLDSPAGVYTVRVSSDGFDDSIQTVTVKPGDAMPCEFVLALAAAHQTVTVTEPAAYQVPAISSGTKTMTPLSDLPQSVTVVTRDLIADQMMMS